MAFDIEHFNTRLRFFFSSSIERVEKKPFPNGSGILMGFFSCFTWIFALFQLKRGFGEIRTVFSSIQCVFFFVCSVCFHFLNIWALMNFISSRSYDGSPSRHNIKAWIIEIVVKIAGMFVEHDKNVDCSLWRRLRRFERTACICAHRTIFFFGISINQVVR